MGDWEQSAMPELGLGRLRKLLDEGPVVKAIEVHNGFDWFYC